MTSFTDKVSDLTRRNRKNYLAPDQYVKIGASR